MVFCFLTIADVPFIMDKNVGCCIVSEIHGQGKKCALLTTLIFFLVSKAWYQVEHINDIHPGSQNLYFHVLGMIAEHCRNLAVGCLGK